jgi:thioredoxin 1
MKAIKFYAEWCQPCKMLTKIMEEASDQITTTIEHIDIDKDMQTAIKYGVRGVPTMVLVDDEGKEIGRKVGMMNEQELITFLKG